MPNRIYVDTNIVIDLCDKKRPFHHESVALIGSYIDREDTRLFFNSDTLSNLFYILCNRSKMSLEKTLEMMTFIREFFELVVIGDDEISSALELCARSDTSFNDYEDTMQFVCARKIGADLIVTHDRGFVSDGIEVLVPTL